MPENTTSSSERLADRCRTAYPRTPERYLRVLWHGWWQKLPYMDAIEQAAADAEVEPDEMTGRYCLHTECAKIDDGACWYGEDDPRRWIPRPRLEEY